MFGAQGPAFLEQGGWEFAFGFRYMKSDKHFVGVKEQPHREEEGTQVINHMWLGDFALTYGWTDRTTVTFALPYQVADRSQRINGLVPAARNKTSARGFGDLTVTARRWMLDPAEHPSQNIQLGFGIKLPTGKPNEVDTFRTQSGGIEGQQVVRTVDQSIQPGDGGLGFVAELAAFKQFGRFTPYLSATYLFNPEGTNGVRTYRSRPGEEVMSIADQYVGRVGVQYAVPGLDGFSVGLGGRIEGVPVEDVFGPSKGFRRPGYAVSIEPMLSYAGAKNTFSLSLPIAVQRNREKSVTDKENDHHGDAAFADWVLLLGWTHRF